MMEDIVEDRQGFGFLFVGLTSFVASIIFYYYALRAEIFTVSDYNLWNPSCGFTSAQFAFMVFGTYLLPYSIIFMLIFLSYSYKNMSDYAWYKVTLYVVLFTATVVGCFYAADNSVDVLSCIGMFCTVDSGIATDTGENGAVISMNMIFFFVALFFMLVIAFLVVIVAIRLVARAKSPGTDSQLSERTPLVKANVLATAVTKLNIFDEADRRAMRSEVRKHISTVKRTWLQEMVIITLVFTAFFPIMILACTLLPTWGFYFTRYGIQSYQASQPSAENDIFWSSVGANSVTVLKFYLDILVFYVAIYLVVIFAMIALVWTPMRHFFHYRVTPNLCVGQILVGLTFFGLLAGEFCYWFLIHGWEGQSRTIRSNAEIAARSFGQLGNVIMGLLTLPVAKNSFWSTVFGISWESMIVYHQIMGYSLMIVIALHMFLWWYVYHEQNTFPSDIFAVPMQYHSDNFTVPLAVLTFFIMIIVFGVLTYPTIRRANYELFYFAHFFSGVVFLVVLWHATMAWYYVTAGLFLYVVDHMIRFARSASAGVIVADLSVAHTDSTAFSAHAHTSPDQAQDLYRDAEVLRQEPGIVRLAYTITAPVHSGNKSVPLPHMPGQYCYVNIPKISKLEWHPFSISSAPSDSITTHHIKVMGGLSGLTVGTKQWTAKLYELAVELQALRAQPSKSVGSQVQGQLRSMADVVSDEELVVNVEGPYGLSLEDHLVNCTRAYTHLLFVAGGIGVTPLHSCLRHLYLMAKACEFQPEPQPEAGDEEPGQESGADVESGEGDDDRMQSSGTGRDDTEAETRNFAGYSGGDEAKESTHAGKGVGTKSKNKHMNQNQGQERTKQKQQQQEDKDKDKDKLKTKSADVPRITGTELARVMGVGSGSDPEGEIAFPFPQLQKVRLVWSVKTPGLTGQENIFADTLDLIAVDDVAGMFEVSMHVTNYDNDKDIRHGERLKQFGLRDGRRGAVMHMGRPNIDEEVKAVAKHKGKALLFACGPASLIQDCAAISHKYGIDFRHETFEL